MELVYKKKESKPIHKMNKPELPVLSAADAASQVIADKACRLPGCHGRGYTGVKYLSDGSPVLMLCRCASYGETDRVVLVRENEKLFKVMAEGIDRQYAEFHYRLTQIEAKTFLGTLKRWGSKFKRTHKKKNAEKAE